MAKFQFRGLDEYAEYLQKIQKNTPEILGKGVYEMAGVIADEVRKNIEAIPSVNDTYNIIAYKKGTKSRLSHRQKEGLKDSFGIATMKYDDGYLNVKLGFDGYNSVETEKYPQGQPNALVARSLESGTSYMDKVPFIRNAVNRKREDAITRAKLLIDEEIYAIEKRDFKK